MAHKIERLAILFLGLWLVTAGFGDQWAEAAAGSKSSSYSRPTSSYSKPTEQSLQQRLGQPQRGGELWLCEAGGPCPAVVIPSRPPARPPPAVIPNQRPDCPRRLYQTGGPRSRRLYQAGHRPDRPRRHHLHQT